MRITNGHKLRVAMQSDGRLTRRSLELLRGIGLEFEEHERRLFARCRNADAELLFIRDDDIPEYVQDGVADPGVVGRSVVAEVAVAALAEPERWSEESADLLYHLLVLWRATGVTADHVAAILARRAGDEDR